MVEVSKIFGMKMQFGTHAQGDKYDSLMLLYALSALLACSIWQMVWNFLRASARHFETTERPTLIYDDKQRKYVEQCPSLHAYTPTPYFLGSHAQSTGGFAVAMAQYPNGINYTRHWIGLRDGVEVALDELPPKLKNDAAPVLICFHGIGGCSQDNYLRRFVPQASMAGWRVYVYIRRGHADTWLHPMTSYATLPTCGVEPSSCRSSTCGDADPRASDEDARESPSSSTPPAGLAPYQHGLPRTHTPNRTAMKSYASASRLYASQSMTSIASQTEAEPAMWFKYADVADTDEVVRVVRVRHPGCHVCAVGFSAGSNTLTKYLSEVAGEAKLTAAVSLANALNLSQCSRMIQKHAPRFDILLTCSGQKQVYKRHLSDLKRVTSDLPAVGRAGKVASLRDFDDSVAKSVFGHRHVDDYYVSQSSIDDVEDVKIPLLCLTAWNDPVIHRSLINRLHLYGASNPNIVICTTEEGGHLGWLEGWRAISWANNAILQFLQAQIADASPQPLDYSETQLSTYLQLHTKWRTGSAQLPATVAS